MADPRIVKETLNAVEQLVMELHQAQSKSAQAVQVAAADVLQRLEEAIARMEAEVRALETSLNNCFEMARQDQANRDEALYYGFTGSSVPQVRDCTGEMQSVEAAKQALFDYQWLHQMLTDTLARFDMIEQSTTKRLSHLQNAGGTWLRTRQEALARFDQGGD